MTTSGAPEFHIKPLAVGPDNVVHLGEAAEWWFAAE